MAENNSPSKDIIFRAMWNNMLPMIREQGGDIFGKLVETSVRPIAGDEAMAKRVGELVDNTFQVGVTMSANVRDFTVVAKDSRKRMGALMDDVEPYLVDEFGKSSRGKLMRSKNEVISHERDRQMGQTKYGVFKAASGLADKLPELYGFMDKKRAEIARNGGVTPAEMPSGEVPSIEDVKAKLDESLGKMATAGIFDEDNRKLVDAAIRTGAPALQEYIEAEGVDKFGKTSAFQMIKDLAEQAHSGNGHIGYVMHEATGEQMPLENYVLEVFKQHQQDIGGVPLNDRFRFLPELEEACKTIASEIEDNLLSPMALVSLVGNRKVLDDRLRVADEDVIKGEIKQVWRVIEKCEEVDTKEFIEETAFATPEDFKKILNDLPEAEKPFFVSLFPEAVVKEMGGLKDAEIDKLKDRGAAEFAEHMTTAIETLGTLSEKELQRYGLTAKEGKLMRQLSDAIDEMGAENVVDSLQGQARKDVTEAVRNARGYWQERVAGGAERSRGGAARGEEEPEAAGERKFTDAVAKKEEQSEQRSR